jgi:hypothetical protein
LLMNAGRGDRHMAMLMNAGRRGWVEHSSPSEHIYMMHAPFASLGWTDGETDRQTDGQTRGHAQNAGAHLGVCWVESPGTPAIRESLRKLPQTLA